jgi:hypothetical protein
MLGDLIVHFYLHYFIAGIECIILAFIIPQIFGIYVSHPYFDNIFTNVVFIMLISMGMGCLIYPVHIESWEEPWG